jgi:hypothetical protein
MDWENIQWQTRGFSAVWPASAKGWQLVSHCTIFHA